MTYILNSASMCVCKAKIKLQFNHVYKLNIVMKCLPKQLNEKESTLQFKGVLMAYFHDG